MRIRTVTFAGYCCIASQLSEVHLFSLAGKKALIIGIANEDSIAFGCAKAFREQGADLAITYPSEKAERFVRPIAEGLGADIILPLDVREDAQYAQLFDRIGADWGQVDICLHGGTCMTISYLGADRVVEHYNIMGPVKAALESATRYMAAELGPKGINVHALSPGPLKTRAASGIEHFDELMAQTSARAPTHHLATNGAVGAYAAFLASSEATNVTGGGDYIDGGYHIVG